jgi:energy-coupling factor transport system permease protein
MIFGEGIMRTPTLYLPRQSGFHDLHPMTKLALTGLFLVAAATLPNVFWVIGLYLVGLLPLALWGRVFLPFVKTTLLLIWPFALSLFLIQGFFAPGDHIIFRIGFLSMKAEGLWLAGGYAARILVWLGAATLFMLATQPDKIMLALRERGMPRQIGYIILTSLQIIPRFQSRAQTILDAQRSRGLETEGSLIHRLRMLVPLIAPLILSSLLELDDRAIALEARAFSHPGPRTSLVELSDAPWQMLMRRLVLGLMLALAAARLARFILR